MFFAKNNKIDLLSNKNIILIGKQI